MYHQLTIKRDQRTVQRENQTQYSLQLLCAEALAQLPCLFSVLEHVRHFVYVQHDLFVCGMNVETALFSVDIDLCINSLMVDIYSHVYSKHVKTQEPSIDMVLEDLQNSKLSDKIKSEMPTYCSLESTIRNIQWVVNYWGVENGDPLCDHNGADGFTLHNNRVVFSDRIL